VHLVSISGRRLAERQQTRHIRESTRPDLLRLRDHLKRPRIAQHRDGHDLLPAHKRAIRPGDGPDRPCQRLYPNLRRQLALKRDGLARSDVP
jgi:hypothetical protein